jgi:cell fate regulator YaaT (PSP1 superfamily)
MIKVVGVRFKKAGKIYYFDPEKKWINNGDFVIVETIRGIEYGQVVVGPKMVKEENIVQPLKKVLRVATEEDKRINQENTEKEKEAFDICLKKIEEHGLEMKLIDIEYTFDNNKVIFYFTADAIFRTRIELRQIGVRDEAKMIGGIGPCGRHMCCASFLGEFYPVSIKMAKEQKLSLNPAKISGICSRLMCCLNYEHQVYEENIKKLPDLGDRVQVLGTNKTGIVLDINPLFVTAKVNVEKSDGTIEVEEIRGEDLKVVEEGVFKPYDEKDIDIDMDELKELED